MNTPLATEVAGRQAEPVMATITSASSSEPANRHAAGPGILHEIRQFWQLFFVAAFDPYRPEQHYMRGPGPACRAKTPSQSSSLSH
jgi:hypothetical protein